MFDYAGKKSREESLWILPFQNLSLVIFSSHQWSCCSLILFILKTLETIFISIKPITVSISSSSFWDFFFISLHFLLLCRSFNLVFFCNQWINQTKCMILSIKTRSLTLWMAFRMRLTSVGSTDGVGFDLQNDLNKQNFSLSPFRNLMNVLITSSIILRNSGDDILELKCSTFPSSSSQP